MRSLQLMPMHAQPCWSCCQLAKSGNAVKLHGTLCCLRVCMINVENNMWLQGSQAIRLRQ